MVNRKNRLPKSLENINLLAENVRNTLNDDNSNKRLSITTTTTTHDTNKLNILYNELKLKYDELKDDRNQILDREKHMQEMYIQKELKFKEKLSILEEDIKNSNKIQYHNNNISQYMTNINNIHQNIQDRIGDIQQQTKKVLQEQEYDLIKAFKIKLLEITKELEKERKRNEIGAAEWVVKCRKLAEELSYYKKETEKLIDINEKISNENIKYKKSLHSKDEDREFLVKQFVSVKKENNRLRDTIEQIKAEKLLGNKNKIKKKY